jgi:hypothetical protein
MALTGTKTSAFGFTNASDSSNEVTAKSLGLTSNYSLTADNADVATLNNKTAPVDQEEIISFRSRDIGAVNTTLNIQYPSKVKSGIEYSLKIEDTLSTTDSADADFRVDEPIICTITFRHPKSGNIGGDQVATVFVRALSALMKADGTWRFDDLMRSAERPVVD